MNKRSADLVRFYRLIDDLAEMSGGPYRLATVRQDQPWPACGVIWFYEKGEMRSDSGTGPRVVRVGTHALKPEANSRLSEKLAQDGAGSHRQSAFRTIIGLSIRDLTGRVEPRRWGRKAAMAGAAPERAELALEEAVSLYIGQMDFVVLAVQDAPGPRSERAFIERNSIALLSNYARPKLDAASVGWLGHRCGREKVRQSGLWNTQHVDAAYDSSFMDTMRMWMEDMRPSR